MKNIAPLVGGLDQSLNATGFVVLPLAGGDVPTYQTCVVPIVDKVELRGLPRFRYVRDTVSALVYEHKLTHVFMEGYGFGAKGAALFQLGGIGEILKLSLAEMGVTIIVVPPTVLKQFATDRGNAKKEEMLLAVYMKWGFQTRDNNIADAYTLAQLGRAWLDPKSKKHRDLFKKVTVDQPLV